MSHVGNELPRTGLIGFGYWGRNWARVLHRLGALAWIVDSSAAQRDAARTTYPGIPSPEEADWEACEAVIVATPPSTHHDLAIAALQLGKHVLVEKPLALTLSEGKRMCEVAEQSGATLVVGHSFLFSETVRKALDMAGRVGALQHLRLEWCSDGQVRQDVDVMWNVGPHPLSVLLHLVPGLPERWTARTVHWARNAQPNIAYLSAVYSGGPTVELTLSTLDARKTRRLLILAENGRVSCEPLGREVMRLDDSGTEITTVVEPEVLEVEFLEFAESCRTGVPSRADARVSGLNVLRMLEDIKQAALAAAGRVGT